MIREPFALRRAALDNELGFPWRRPSKKSQLVVDMTEDGNTVFYVASSFVKSGLFLCLAARFHPLFLHSFESCSQGEYKDL